jgi:putative ABC transport system permease protein
VSLWRQLTHGLRTLVRRREAEHDLADEVQHWLEQSTAAHARDGLPPDHAARAALLEMGPATAVREQVRSAAWEQMVASALADARYALRRLRLAPAFTLTAVATLALGIGASTAVFSAVSPVLLEPLPFPAADRLVTVADRGADGSPLDATFGTYDELLARSRSFDALAGADRWQPSLTGVGDPERLDGQRVTSGYFGVFGVVPPIGRDFTAADDRPGAPNVVILSDGLLQRRFGGDRSIVGRSI